jgi:outer membrane protein TolC
LILNTQIQGLTPDPGGGSGIENLSYLSVEFRPRSIEAFREAVDLSSVTVLAPAGLLQALPDLATRIRALEAAAGLDVTVLPVGASASEALDALGPEPGGVFVLPLPDLNRAEFQILTAGLKERGAPSFSWFGAPEVRDGILVGRLPDSFGQQLARRAAISVQRIALGDEPARLQVLLPAQEQATLNVATAQAIGVYPRWRSFIEAQLIEDPSQVGGEPLTLAQAVDEAVAVNLDLAAANRLVAAGEEAVKIATSPLLPQLGIGADGLVVDEDRAEASLGIIPQRSLSASAGLSQVVFDERLWADRSIEKSLQRSRVEDLETLRLDIVADAAVAYLNVLRAASFEQIRRSNLATTRSNLELAQIRLQVGVADASEVSRWETQIANDRQSVIDAGALTRRSEIAVLRILARSQAEPFSTVEVDLGDPSLITSHETLGRFLQDPWSFERFQGFIAAEALANSPELAALDALVDAEERALAAASRAFFLPTARFDAGSTAFLARSGAGSEPGGEVDDVRWAVGLNLSYPIFTGLARSAERARAREEVQRLQLQRRALADRVEQRVRDAAYLLGASRVNIDLSREAYEAADRTYTLVRDAYARGVGSILEVLDAQNQAVTAREEAATAQYTFLIDLMNTERATGRFYFFASPDQFTHFLQRLQAYFNAFGEGDR